jgi:hypothetical protein
MEKKKSIFFQFGGGVDLVTVDVTILKDKEVYITQKKE